MNAVLEFDFKNAANVNGVSHLASSLAGGHLASAGV